MEIHHHPHVEKKNFKEYFLEFLMIFLAVTMGFIAENIREHYAEQNITKEFLENYKTELIQHQNIFKSCIKDLQNKIMICDSAKQIIYNGEENKKLSLLDHLFFHMNNLQIIQINTSSYDQMVSSGGLRLIHNSALLSSMGTYRSEIEGFKNYNSRITEAELNMEPEISKIQDFHDFIHEYSAEPQNDTSIMKPFAPMSREQRGLMVWYYELFFVQARSNLSLTNRLKKHDEDLLKMVDNELKN